MQRRQFLKTSIPVLVLLANGEIVQGTGKYLAENGKKSKLRFAVASDGHYGQPGTEYAKNYQQVVEQINLQHKKKRLDCCIINGDIIHNSPSFLAPAKKCLDQLKMPYYVTQGNHDMVTEAVWTDTWNMPFNYAFVMKGQVFILASSSNEKGDYLCPDLIWMKAQLEKHKAAENVFIFVHITQVKWTKYGIDSPDFIDLISQYKNVRTVFHGHDHDQDDVKSKNNITFLFDSHIGSSWGTAYKGYRIVELMDDNSIVTYMMNPIDKLNELVLNLSDK
ncbi:putative phosphodiesterase [Pedobacter sp. AK017]|uniref:metallophosphoesterase family protein n=1 Tax=Pedobacter sp. AK017 TaxID=2723073 RepID=UPI00161C5B0F|nr:metallophosphoesterase [Pedobacter sp. AK017]MBB5438902.1 putative phosphodiesterase [Pedobacter sp. AK017]